jgi:hypothetical protein
MKLCAIGIHKWGKVKQWEGKQKCMCKKCGKLKDK